MKQTLITTALVCATLLATGTLMAGGVHGGRPKAYATSQTVWAEQSPYPAARTPVAGYSPNLAAPQPATKATLTPDANRLIRWQGWQDVDAFSVSVLNQMQKQLGNGIEVGSFDITEPAIDDAVAKREACDPTFKVDEILAEGAGIQFENTPTLYVWTYRHNFTDAGLHQLYVSAKGKMVIGTTKRPDQPWEKPVLHNDIQSLNYEFGSDGSEGGIITGPRVPVYADIEIWRGAVVEVNPTGAIAVVGNLAEVVVNYEGSVEAAPVSDWERAPSLIYNPNYNPKCATGAAFVEPLERAISIRENTVQKQAGDVQKRVRTITPFRYR